MRGNDINSFEHPSLKMTVYLDDSSQDSLGVTPLLSKWNNDMKLEQGMQRYIRLNLLEGY